MNLPHHKVQRAFASSVRSILDFEAVHTADTPGAARDRYEFRSRGLIKKGCCGLEEQERAEGVDRVV